MPVGDVAAVDRAERRVRVELNAADLVERLRLPDIEGMRAFVRVVDRCLVRLNRAAGLTDPLASVVWGSALQSAFPAVVCFRHDRRELAPEWLLFIWKATARALAGTPLRLDPGSFIDTAEVLAREVDEIEHLGSFNAAVLERLTEKEKGRKAHLVLQRLRLHLGLSFDELGRAFGVTGETVRRWARGSTGVTSERMAELASAEAALRRLLGLFRPESLPHVVRREAKLFQGDPALDWILRRRIVEVADRYEAALSYQG